MTIELFKSAKLKCDKAPVVKNFLSPASKKWLKGVNCMRVTSIQNGGLFHKLSVQRKTLHIPPHSSKEKGNRNEFCRKWVHRPFIFFVWCQKTRPGKAIQCSEPEFSSIFIIIFLKKESKKSVKDGKKSILFEIRLRKNLTALQIEIIMESKAHIKPENYILIRVLSRSLQKSIGYFPRKAIYRPNSLTQNSPLQLQNNIQEDWWEVLEYLALSLEWTIMRGMIILW